MKKVLWLIVCLMTMVFTSCGSVYKITAEYEVCYPDGVKKYTNAVTVASNSEPWVNDYSVGGSNYISVFGYDYIIKDASKIKTLGILESSTAPMRLIKYNAVKVKGRTNNQNKYGDNVYIY